MSNREIKTLTKTSKKYSVVFGCYDPPIPVEFYNTNSLRRAKSIFKEIKESEIEEYKKTDVVGGEWGVSLYCHTPQTELEIHRTDPPEVYIYNIIYKNSEEIDKFGYMDLYDYEEQEDEND